MAATTEDAEFLHMIQVGSGMRQRSVMFQKLNSNDTISSNVTIVEMLQKHMDAVFKFHSALKTSGSTSAALSTVATVFILIVSLMFLCFCFVACNYSISNKATNQWSPEQGGPPEGSPQRPRRSTLLSCSEDSIMGIGSPKQTPNFEKADPTIICPKLVNSSIITRLAFPVKPLDATDFDVDVLALTGMPLLSLKLGGGDTGLAINLCKTGTLLCLITTKCRIIDAKGTHLGTLTPIGPKQYGLRDRFGHNLLMINPSDEPGKALMVKECDGLITDYAQMSRRQASEHGQLNQEHYELMVNPGNDTVLALACFLALILFALPHKRTA